MKFRKPKKITHRISAVTNGFVQAILPITVPSDEEIDSLLNLLGMDRESIECIYCGGPFTDWDHLRPLVKNRRPTNNLTNHLNLVPACGPCNQSKGGQEWRSWIAGHAIGSPASRGIDDLAKRIARLEKFEVMGNGEQHDLAGIIGPELWDGYWSKLAEVERHMREAQDMAVIIQKKVQTAFNGKSK